MKKAIYAAVLVASLCVHANAGEINNKSSYCDYMSFSQWALSLVGNESQRIDCGEELIQSIYSDDAETFKALTKKTKFQLQAKYYRKELKKKGTSFPLFKDSLEFDPFVPLANELVKIIKLNEDEVIKADKILKIFRFSSQNMEYTYYGDAWHDLSRDVTAARIFQQLRVYDSCRNGVVEGTGCRVSPHYEHKIIQILLKATSITKENYIEALFEIGSRELKSDMSKALLNASYIITDDNRFNSTFRDRAYYRNLADWVKVYPALEAYVGDMVDLTKSE